MRSKNNYLSIQERYRSGEQMSFSLFWGVDERYGSFCQWYQSEFTMGEFTYKCAEQAMMAEKARTFGDGKILLEIMNYGHEPQYVKHLGRKVKNFDHFIWDSMRLEKVRDINYHKFTQNEDLKDILLSTGDSIIVEASPFDKIWGVGLSEHSSGVTVPTQWTGQNLLGEALMDVRDQIRKSMGLFVNE